MCVNKVPSEIFLINKEYTFEGELKIKGSIHRLLEAISHIEKNAIKIIN